MARPPGDASAPAIPLCHPDRTKPLAKTLLQLAEERHLHRQQQHGSTAPRPPPEKRSGPRPEERTCSPRAEQLLEAALWTVTLAMVHFTLDVLVQHQYGTHIVWSSVVVRTARAWLFFLFLFYALHPFSADSPLLSGLPRRWQRPLRQVIFFSAGVVAGCYLIHLTNAYGYLAVMKQAPPLACLWLWSVVELDLAPALCNVAVAGVFIWIKGYDFK